MCESERILPLLSNETCSPNGKTQMNGRDPVVLLPPFPPTPVKITASRAISPISSPEPRIPSSSSHRPCRPLPCSSTASSTSSSSDTASSPASKALSFLRISASPVAAANPTFSDGVATKDVHVGPLTSLSVRIFLPSSNGIGLTATHGVYKGYLPPWVEARGRGGNFRRLPVVLQFHGGGFVEGSSVSLANDLFCRRIAKLCDVIVVAVGYRLAPESRYPSAFEDGMEVLSWLGKQANLAEYGRSMGRGPANRDIVRTFGDTVVEPWMAAHGDPSRCVLLGVSSGANFADYVARRAVEAGKLLDPVKVVAQVLMYPFFIGSQSTRTEMKLANSYLYDKSMWVLAWKLFLPEEEFGLDHPAANPLVRGRGGPPPKQMPPTLTVVAEHDWMRDRAIAYSNELPMAGVDAPVLEYKDSVHEFATLDMLLKTPQALACAEDIAIWVKKYVSTRGHEFSY